MPERSDLLGQIYSTEIESDENDNKKNELFEEINKTHDILRYYENKFGKESKKYKQINSEYEDVRNIIIESVNSQQLITNIELKNIKNEIEEVFDQESWFEKKKRNVDDFLDDTKENGQYINTIRKIEWSNSSEEVENKIHGILTESQQYLNGSKNTEYFSNVEDLYDEINSAINEALGENKKFESNEILNIQKKYYDLLIFTKENGINKEGIKISEKRLEKHKEGENETLLFGKDINDSWSESELYSALQILQNNYTSYEGSFISSLDAKAEFFSSTNTIFDVDTKTEANILQEKIIQKLLGSDDLIENGYNSQFIHGFGSTRGGNFLVSKNDFKNELKNNTPDNWNSLAFANYIQSFQGNISGKHLVEICGVNNIKKLGDLWKKGDNYSGIAEKRLIEAGQGNIIEEVQNVENVFGSIENIISSNLTQNEKEIAQAYLETNNEAKEKFKQLLISQLQGKVENPDEVSNEIIQEMLGNKPENIFEVLINFENVYGIDLINGDILDTGLCTYKEYNNNNLLQARIDNNAELINKSISYGQQIETIILMKTNKTEEEIREYSYRINNENITFQDIVNEERKKDEALNQALNKIEERFNLIRTENNILKGENENINSTQEEQIFSIDNKSQSDITYENYSLDTTNKEKPSLISTSGEYVEITTTEAKTIENNPEALKNLLDMREKLSDLGLNFIWDYREDYIKTMKSTPGFIDAEMNTGDDFINRKEFNNLLKFTLSLLGETHANSYSGNIGKIIKLSSVSETDNKKDFITGYGKIGTQLYQMGYIGESSIDTENITKMQNYKQTIIDFNNKK